MKVIGSSVTPLAPDDVAGHTETDVHALLRLLRAALEIGSTLDPRDVITRVLRHGVATVHADRATLSRITGDHLIVEATYGRTGDLTWIGRTYPLEVVYRQPAVRRAIERRQLTMSGQLDVASAQPEFRPALEAMHHTATLPLLAGDGVIGVLVFSRAQDPPFGEAELEPLRLIDAIAGLALRNALVHEAEQQARALAEAAAVQMRQAVSATREVAREQDISRMLRSLILGACEASGADGGSVAHVEGDDMILDAVTGPPHGGNPGTSALIGTRWPLSDAARRAAKDGRPRELLASEYIGAPTGFEHVTAPYRRFLVMPLVAAGETVGMLALGRRADAPFEHERLDALRQFTGIAALLLRNARLLDRARDAEHAKSEFMNIAVHEIKSPLTVAIGYTSMLLDGTYGEPHPAMRAPLELVAAKAREVYALAEELLMVARLEGGALLIEPRAFDVVAAVGDAVARERARAEMHGGAITVSGAESLEAYGDRDLCVRLVGNLLSNALTYSDAEPEVTVEIRDADGFAEVTVSDRGWGIRDEDRERIFERFSRGSHEGHGARSGSGLGLYISRGMARLMGGDLLLRESPPGGGSTFELRLPTTPRR